MIMKEDLEALYKAVGARNIKFANGVVKHVTPNPLDDLCVVDGKLHSDAELIQRVNALDDNVRYLLDHRFVARPVQNSDNVVGTRHTSLSQAYYAALDANSTLRAAVEDLQSNPPLQSKVNDSTAPGNPGNSQST